MNPVLLIGLAAVAILALRGSAEDGDDEAVDEGGNDGDDGADDLGEEPNSGEISGRNGTWRWTAFAVSERMDGLTIDPAAATDWRWTVGKIDDSSLDVDGTASNREQARAAGILKAMQLANQAPSGAPATRVALG